MNILAGRPRRAGGCLAALTVAMVALIAGCTTTPELRPRAETAIAYAPVPKTIGVYYPASFRGLRHVADPYGNRHEVIFEVGKASVVLLDAVLSKLFRGVTHVAGPVATGSPATGLDAIIEPRVTHFRFYSRLAGQWHYWAEVEYEFLLRAPGGAPITSWRTRGTGESRLDGVGESASWSRAVELAMQDAARHLARSFEDVPEAIRWSTGLDPGAATASPGAHRLRAVSGPGPAARYAAYDGIVAVRATGTGEGDDPALREAARDLAAAGLVAVAVELRNEGPAPLLVEDSGVALTLSGTTAIGPVPTTFFTALATASLGRLPGIAAGPGPGPAVAQLLFALVNISAMSTEAGQKASMTEIFEGHELVSTRIPPGEDRRGLLFFAARPETVGSGTAALRIPVVDPVSAIRYVLDVPVAGLAGPRP